MSNITHGMRIGNLTVQSEVGRTKTLHKLWSCVCICGNEVLRGSHTLKNAINSESNSHCGCLNNHAKKHGFRGTSTYSSWQSAKQRCFNPKSKDYSRYGAIGISMSKNWSESFESFLKDMGHRPINTSLDRINPLGNYEHGNCRWATIDEQANNKVKPIKKIQFKGSFVTAKELSNIFNISVCAAHQRMNRGRVNV